jgi:hypothetical protein
MTAVTATSKVAKYLSEHPLMKRPRRELPSKEGRRGINRRAGTPPLKKAGIKEKIC